MANFCGECGAPLDGAVRFCAACGAPVEQESEQAQPVFEQAHAAPEISPLREGGVAVAAPPMPKQPMKRRTRIAIIAAAAVVVVALTGWLVCRDLFSAEKTMDRFLEALEASDYAALDKVAVSADAAAALTQESAQPLFALYQNDSDFRELLEQTLSSQVSALERGRKVEEDVVTLVADKRLLVLPGYRVTIAVGTAEISSNLCEATVELPDGRIVTFESIGSRPLQNDAYTVYDPRYANAEWGTASIDKLLPGEYQIVGTYDTGYGHTVVEKDSVLRVIPGGYSDCEVYFDCEPVDVYNDSNVEISILIDGKEQLRIPAGADGYLGPMAPKTELEARAELTGLDETLTQSFLAGEGYFCATFSLCELDINNYYDLPIRVYRDETLLATVPANEYGTVEGFPTETELTLRLGDDDALVEPVVYVCSYEVDFLTPDFTLQEEPLQSLQKVVSDYIAVAFDAYNRRDSAALAAMVDTELSSALTENLHYIASNLRSAYEITGTQFSDYKFGVTDGGAVQVTIDGEIDYTFSLYQVNGTTETLSDSSEDTYYCSFDYAYQDGTWIIAPET